ncbi:MAG: hypothetical protein GEU79_13990 [Acidimicrobiia bacterium]|nr:hypothetical protein [Acidimicrobiia bacterium]
MHLLKRDEIAMARLQKLQFSPLAVTGGEGVYLSWRMDGFYSNSRRRGSSESGTFPSRYP